MSAHSIELICFPGAPNLPIYVAQKKGWFEKNGVSINMTTTPSSAFQAENLARASSRSPAPRSTTWSPIRKARARCR